MRIIFCFITLLNLLSVSVIGQIEGEVSYKSSQHYYVRFNSTKGLSVSDTLYIINAAPVLVIKYISERSCACSLISQNELSEGERVYGKKRNNLSLIFTSIVTPEVNSSIETKQKVIKQALSDQKSNTVQVPIDALKYHGRLAVQNYNTFTNSIPDFQRSRYTFSGKIENIANVFSLSTYLHYSKNESFYSFNVEKKVNIYDLNLTYRPNRQFSLWIGRYLNPRISSISTVDGVQAEKKLNKYFVGILGGSRPDFNNMGYNIHLLEYGIYAGRADTISGGFMESSLAFFQQTNNSAIDRRFIYLQHQNNIFRNFNLFLSTEVDLYSRENGKGLNKLSAAGIFFYSRYTPVKIISFSLSYDARKNVIYYETFKNFADSILDKETRQGVRLGINLRPFNHVSIGVNSGYRYKVKDLKPSRNINAYLSYSAIPLIRASGSINVTKLVTSYLDGLSYGINISKELFGELSTTINIRKVDYLFTNSEMKQNIISTDISYRISKILFLFTSYEILFEKVYTSQRLMFDISLRL